MGNRRFFYWDYFIDYCYENGLDYESEDYDLWLDEYHPE